MNHGLLILILIIALPLLYKGIRLISRRPIRTDVPGSMEDGHFQRFPGAVIEFYRHEKDMHRMVLSDPVLKSNQAEGFQTKDIFGLRKTVIYQIPVYHDPLPVYEYYINEFWNNGFEVLYSVFGEEKMGRPRTWFRNLYFTGKNEGIWKDLAMIMDGNIHCYISGEKKKGSTMIYASLFSVNHYRNDKRTGVFIFISEIPAVS